MIVRFLTIIVLLSSLALACPPEDIFKFELKKGLFNYLENPAESRVTLFEVKDMLVFYLTANITSSDCDTVIGPESGLDISTIISKTASVHQSVIPRCSDSTPYGECSDRQPKFCYSGMLRIMCQGPDNIPGTADDCGCSEFEFCETDGSCHSTLIDCYSDSDCGLSAYVGNATCNGNQIEQQYINFTCNFPGTSGSYCDVMNSTEVLATCITCVDGACV